ncbi:hypothetical protein PFICI_10247 [Pestalotiopsis fici W106-1]|uniref:Adenosine deaminase domain-containing protein n=1 Tax=Pestalotiopsis fici (strain W106-1 / CGMCC3.15140) TaxID=1229662 RepID=W3WWG2_PESFW|nr:uncharacterized protein PFICI_10247 [Pestalotiopsis fici W106-1]ETS78185.1 hypothetical protein PFICI_10247 [Pestalotiopsis fici W106-1]
MGASAPEEALVLGRYDKQVSTKLDGLDAQNPLFYEKKETLDAKHAQRRRQQQQQQQQLDQQPEQSKPTSEELEPEYFRDRAEIKRRGQQLAFDHALTENADDAERKAKNLLDIVRHNDDVAFYSQAEPLTGYRGQKHRRWAGDHFLTNWDILNETVLFKVTTRMPKGAHLHIHFNSTLLPHVLLDIAQGMEQMYISSDKPLDSVDNFNTCEIQFLMKSEDVVAADRTKLRNIGPRELSSRSSSDTHNLFSSNFVQLTDERNQRLSWMKYRTFREQWDQRRKKGSVLPETLSRGLGVSGAGHSQSDKGAGAMTWKDWLISKLVFDDQEAHNSLQTAEGAWEKFNGRTRMMKGLFNYETAFVKYTWSCLEEFERDRIQYAEIRPNFMMTNQIYTDDGSKQLDNRETMKKIVEIFQKFKQQRPSTTVCGLKVIYCTPRSFSADKVEASLNECLSFKTGEFRDYIAGFDLVGEEAQGKPLKAFIPEFLEFKRKCREQKVNIPFLFHCGETLELGGDTDDNLLDALLLDSKRIGHGFALARKPYLISEFKKRDICLELCPISNQVLGLTPRMNGHAMYELLANDVHCTLSSDNGTLFKSTLSHDFYEVMVGSKAMTLHGWRQLIEWSIKHASLDSAERSKLEEVWTKLWAQFVEWIIDSFDHVEPIVAPPAKPSTSRKNGESDEALQERLKAEKSQYDLDHSNFLKQIEAWKAKAAKL